MTLEERIINHSKELFLKYGIKSISMDDISSHLGISKKTLYNYISNKDELVDKIVEQHLAQNKEEINQIIESSTDAIDEMVKMTDHILLFLANMSPFIIHDLKKYHPRTWKKIVAFQNLFVEKNLLNNLLRGQQEGLYRKNMNGEIISKLYIYKSNALTDTSLFPPDRFDRIDLFKETIRYHLFGIVTDAGHQLILKNHKSYS